LHIRAGISGSLFRTVINNLLEASTGSSAGEEDDLDA
jgi:hypothetical protein